MLEGVQAGKTRRVRHAVRHRHFDADYE